MTPSSLIITPGAVQLFPMKYEIELDAWDYYDKILLQPLS